MFRFFCAGRGCANASLRSHQILMLCALAFLCLCVLCLGVFSNFDALATNNVAYAITSAGLSEDNLIFNSYGAWWNYDFENVSSTYLPVASIDGVSLTARNCSISGNTITMHGDNCSFIYTFANSYTLTSTYMMFAVGLTTNVGITCSVSFYNGINSTISGGAKLLTSTTVYQEYSMSSLSSVGNNSTLTITFAGASDSTFIVDWLHLANSRYFRGYVTPSFKYFGYNNGYNVGYQEGYNVGYEEGSEGSGSESYLEGYNAGYQDGLDIGLDQGYEEGFDDGSQRGYINNLPLALYTPNQAYASYADFINVSSFTYNGLSYSGDNADQSYEINGVYRYEFESYDTSSVGCRFTSSFEGSNFNVAFGVDTHQNYNSLKGVLFKSDNFSYYYVLTSDNAVFSSYVDASKRATYYSLTVTDLDYDTYYIYLLFNNNVGSSSYDACLVLPFSVACDTGDDALTLQDSYNQGFEDGQYVGNREGRAESWQEGYSSGYNVGYNTGASASEYTFLSLFGAVIDAPIQAFNGLFNFDILGVNMRTFLLAILTLSIALFIWKIIVRGG